MTNLCPADETNPTCDEVLNACDKALIAREYEVKLGDLAIKQLQERNTELVYRVEDLQKKESSIWRNPWLYFGLGVVGGFLLAK